MMLPETLEENLRRYGWTFQRLVDAETPMWRTGFQGERSAFSMQIGLSDAFLTFEIVPLIEWPLDWQEWPELLFEMLEMNANMKMVKLGLDPQGSLMLSCQLPTVGLGYEAMETSLSVLGYYVDEVVSRLALLMRELGCCRDRAPLI